MRLFPLSAALMVAGVLIAGPVYAQQSSTKQKTDGDGLTVVGPGSNAYKQKTDGDSPTIVGPGSRAWKQGTQSMSHSDGSPVGVAKRN